jgi:hypothetical protein
LTLIGWGQPVESHDGGVPADVARVLARALTSVARVTFPSSSVHAIATSVWSPLDGDLARAAGKGFAGCIVAKLRGSPTEVALMSTLRPETAMRLFDDAGLRPGVDGDVAGLLSLTDGFDRSVLAVLERETQLAGFDWALLPESVFPLG